MQKPIKIHVSPRDYKPLTLWQYTSRLNGGFTAYFHRQIRVMWPFLIGWAVVFAGIIKIDSSITPEQRAKSVATQQINYWRAKANQKKQEESH